MAWTDTWVAAKSWLSGKVTPLGVEEEVDEAGNQWSALRGASERTLVLGGHIDSVPNGWLDGSLNVVAGVEVLRRIAEEGMPPVTVRLVSWADEEGSALRPLAVRLERRLGDHGRPGRASGAHRRRMGSAGRTPWPSTTSTSTARSTPARS